MKADRGPRRKKPLGAGLTLAKIKWSGSRPRVLVDLDTRYGKAKQHANKQKGSVVAIKIKTKLEQLYWSQKNYSSCKKKKKKKIQTQNSQCSTI